MRAFTLVRAAARRAVTFSVLALCLPAWAQAAEISVGEAIYHDTSPPLSEMAGNMPLAAPSENRTVPIGERPDFNPDPAKATPDGKLQTQAAPGGSLGPTPAPSASFQGLSDDDNAVVVGTRIVPPDTNGDIGLDENGNKIYIQYINLIWAIYSETGTLVAGPFPGNSVWQGFGGFCEANNDGDPVVLWDDHAGRWFLSQFSINQGIQCVAVSTSADPLGTYHRYAFVVTPGGSNDYPKLGVWDDGTTGSSGQSAYTFTLRDFGGAGGSFSVSAGVMERDAMLAGHAAQFVKFSNPCFANNCIEGQLPPHMDGPQAPANTCPTFWTAVDAAYDDDPAGVDGYRNHTLCVDWSNTGGSTYSENPIVPANSGFDRFLGNGFSDCISPVNGGEVLDCLAAFTMYRAQYRWFGSYASVVLNTTVDAGNDRAGIRWAEVRSADGDSGWALEQEGTYAPGDGLERWMGSIAQDQDGNIALGYSVTGGSLFPSVRYTSRMAGDALGTMPGGEVSCHEGTGAQISSANRWGDYSSMSVDPVDDCTFWFTQEYYENTNSFDFKTRICSFKFEDCGGGVCEPTEPNTELTCDDNADNDCDGQIDCDDSDCYGVGSCPVPVCDNDGVCEDGEDCNNCPNDCIGGDSAGAVCGNGICETANGEDCLTCAADCNGTQNGRPSGRFCCGNGGENPVGCGDSRCDSGGFQCTTSPAAGGSYCCGDGACDVPEDGFSCALDCGAPPVCGDNMAEFPEVCDGTDLMGETCQSQGFQSGILACNSDCGGYDTTGCVPFACGVKGDSCSDNSDCCSNACKPNGTCR